MRNDMIVHHALKRDTEIFKQLYLEASKRLREIKLLQAFQTNNVSLVEKALTPIEPIPSQAKMYLVLSFLLSCSLGICAAFVREFADHRFQHATEVESVLQIPFLGAISHDAAARLRPRQPVMLHAPASSVAEDYRGLRTRLQTSPLAMKTLLVTSAVPSEGKSTTTANLGIAFAHLGYRVLLVDTDLRRPSLHHHFHVSRDVGLTNVLVDGITWQHAVQDTAIEQLKILPAGTTTHNSSDVLSLNDIKQCMQHFRSCFDLVIFDAPIMLCVNDVEIIAPDVDRVLFVHSPRQCNKDSVIEAKKLLDRVGANIAGIVFSNVKEVEQKYFYQQKRFQYEYQEQRSEAPKPN